MARFPFDFRPKVRALPFAVGVASAATRREWGFQAPISLSNNFAPYGAPTKLLNNANLRRGPTAVPLPSPRLPCVSKQATMAPNKAASARLAVCPQVPQSLPLAHTNAWCNPAPKKSPQHHKPDLAAHFPSLLFGCPFHSSTPSRCPTIGSSGRFTVCSRQREPIGTAGFADGR